MHTVVVPFLVASVACASPPPRAHPRADRPRYELTVNVARTFRTVTGVVDVTFTPNRPIDRLVFRLWANSPPSRREGARLDPGRVTSRDVRPKPTTLVIPIGPHPAGPPLHV